MPSMPQPEDLSELQERMLLAIWKSGSVGRTMIEEGRLKAELGNDPAEAIDEAIEHLHQQGFVSKNQSEGVRHVSLTPLGLAILRKLEEDRLQELK
jgi:DNA-binding MarR family transcriptional regulator